MSGASASPTRRADDLRGQRAHKAIVNPVGHDDSARSRASLAGGEKRAVERALNRAVEIAVIQHDERILAAHLQLHACLMRHRRAGDASTNALRTGKRNRRDIRMQREHVARRAAADHEVEHALRRAGLVNDLRHRKGDRRRQRRGLHHDRVAERQRGRALPRRNRDREIPGRDQADDAERLAVSCHINPGRVESTVTP